MYASAASQTSPNELLANGSSLRSEAQEFRPAVGTPPQAGTVFDAREWYAPVAAYTPVPFIFKSVFQTQTLHPGDGDLRIDSSCRRDTCVHGGSSYLHVGWNLEKN